MESHGGLGPVGEYCWEGSLGIYQMPLAGKIQTMSPCLISMAWARLLHVMGTFN